METTLISPTLIAVIIIAALFELIMKAFALWKAARANHRDWFIVLLLINTAGILPLIYMKFINNNKI